MHPFEMDSLDCIGVLRPRAIDTSHLSFPKGLLHGSNLAPHALLEWMTLIIFQLHVSRVLITLSFDCSIL
jgi:hypothetical protein